MAVETVRFSGTDTENKPSGTIWGKCPWNAIGERSVNGVRHWDDFSSFNITPATTEGNWTAQTGYAQFSGTGGTITAPALSAATKAGVPASGITIGSDDDNEGVAARTVSVPYALNRANQRFWFEACFKKSSIANTILEFFIGLLENVALTATVPITTTAGLLSDNNLVGIHSTESAGSKASTKYKANGVTAVVVGTDEITFVADTFTKVGMMYVPSGDKDGSYCLSFYQDGVRLASSKIIPDSNGTDFPTDVAMGPVFATRNAAGTSPGTVTLKWWKYAQLYAPLN